MVQLRQKYTFFIVILSLLQLSVYGQKVGVVLSGGGASGISHIGVLKALEENNIPIDYITGSSQGALVGAMYASGYSPLQIEKIVNSSDFNDITRGVIDAKYQYYFKRNSPDASWISIKLALDSTFQTIIPTNLLSPIALDFGLMDLFMSPSAISQYDFDSLFVPFRCLASEIEKKESVIFDNGDLAQAVRASITYPFYIPPIRVNDKLLFDGGLYNNFPSDVMYNDFYPDIIIGSNVGVNSSPEEDNLFSQLKCMLQSESNYDVICENGVIIEPNSEASLFDFSNPQPIIDSGYVATIRKMDLIKSLIVRRTDSSGLAERRSRFLTKAPSPEFDSIYINGLTKKQASYARKILNHKKTLLTIENIKKGYFRLASDDKIKSIYPQVKYNFETKKYDLYLQIRKEKDLITHFGGNLSNRPISEGFVGIQYNYLNRFAASIMGNVYFGKLYSSAQVKTRFDFPFRLPIYIEPNVTWNSWDYYKSSNAFLEDVKPAYLKKNEFYGSLDIGFPTGKKGRVVGGVALFSSTFNYYQTTDFSVQDTADHTYFEGLTSQLYYNVNSLNRKQYANQGEQIVAKIKYVIGNEKTEPGSTSLDTLSEFKKFHEWIQFKLNTEKYFNRRGKLKVGVMGEASYSTQTAFHSYTASTLSAPTFQPTPDSKTIFLAEYQAYKYLAGGLKLIIAIREKLEWRAEGYIFQPYRSLRKTPELTTTFSKPFEFRYFIASSAFVWTTPLGPVSLSANYYPLEKHPVAILFHFGYIIFNKGALD